MAPPGVRTLRIAVIDDDDAVRELMRAALERVGATVDLFPGSQLFLDRAIFTDYDVIFCDLMLPGLSGIDLLFEVRGKAPAVPFVIVSGQAAVSDAIEAMKAGATDFIVKPFRIQSLLDVVNRLTQEVAPRTASGIWRREKEQNFAVGNSVIWKSLLQKARRVAELSSTVLIRGETGTGKEVIAKYIASFGPRAGKPFVSLNCAAIPDDLIESELFGHVRGAFSGATNARRGLFEEAEGGTLLLDEIGSMPLAAQAKVLRALEEFQIRRVGENLNVAVDVRILASTNLDMEAAIQRHIFRDDLYYRLAVVTLWVPPLRERGEDKLALADHFLRMFSTPSQYPRRLSAEAKDLILHDPFPGNIRELKHSIEQACALSSRDELVAEDFPLLLARADAAGASEVGAVSGLTARTLTPERLKEVLERTGGNRVEAARILHISRSTLYRMLGKQAG
ncbi:MAG TPA: sigma-54 dependent transcriptional regulator [Thermoanaerobaculia bacterium]|nr:sigma-54 dependent transcriptional regulator [Thermoanaerobaculia bacterium]